MNSVERVKAICKERKIPISKLEKDLGFSNGYIGQLRKGVFPADRLAAIAEYLELTAEYLMTGKENAPTSEGERNIDPDIRRIERAKYIMPPHEWEYRMSVIKAALGEYYSDDYVDTDTDE